MTSGCEGERRRSQSLLEEAESHAVQQQQPFLGECLMAPGSVDMGLDMDSSDFHVKPDIDVKSDVDAFMEDCVPSLEFSRGTSGESA